MTDDNTKLSLSCELALFKWFEVNGYTFSKKPVGNYLNTVGRDVEFCYRVLTKTGKVLYVYAQAAYVPSSIPGFKKEGIFTSVVLYDWTGSGELCKTHINKKEDMSDFFSQIKNILEDK